MSILSARTVSVKFGSHSILRSVALPDVKEGQFIGLIGPNGSGKTTLLRALAHKNELGGNVTFEGDGLSAPRTVYMPQSLPSPSTLRAYELLSAQTRALGDPLGNDVLHERICHLLERLGISQLALRPMNELSGGQRQLIGFALAVFRTPDLLLLDEPTSALDISWQLRLLEHVRGYLSEKQAACIASLHDIDLAARTCDHLILLDQGRAVASGPPSEVLTQANLLEVYGVKTRLYQRSDERLGIEILGYN